MTYDHYRQWTIEQDKRLQAEAAQRGKNRFFVALAIACWLPAMWEVFHVW